MKHYDKDSKLQCPFCWKDCTLTKETIETLSVDSSLGTITVPHRRIVRFTCDFCETTIVHVDRIDR